jgi:tRNA-2-methylthio-N6-dimethylallyladenosine synthase
VDLIVGTQKFHQVPDYLDNLRAAQDAGTPLASTIVDIAEEPGSQNKIKDHILPQDDFGRAGTPLPAAASSGVDALPQVTAFVSIQQGCNMDCAFCIVPKTRGDERSRPMDEIVRECTELADRGVREVTLLGQIVTSYGRRDYEHTGGLTPFVQLLERVNAIPGIQRIRFTSPHPRGFKDDLIQAYGRLEKLCEYVHLPLQSGSDRILKAMNRPYSRDRYRQIVDELRRVRPDMYFSTDIIVGFPGETAEDFAETRGLFEACNYDMAYIFKYSIRSGTPAATMAAQVPDEVKEARNQELLALLAANSDRRNATLLGTIQEVLVEGPDKKGLGFMGRTRGNRIVHFPAQERLIGELVPVRIERASTAVLYGSLALTGVEV